MWINIAHIGRFIQVENIIMKKKSLFKYGY